MAHETRELSQAEKKNLLLHAEQMHKMTTISLKMVEVISLSVAKLVTAGFFSSLEISHVFHGTTAKKLHRCRGLMGH